MCVASLHATTQPCDHRWYQLVRSCDTSTGKDLQNCTNRLKLAGWENRTDACPWCDCDVATPNNGSYKLLGNPHTGVSTPTSVPAELGVTPPRRVDSWGTMSTMSTLSHPTSVSSIESESAQRHRDMNDRVQMYLTSQPHDILPSASKNYPTYSQGLGGMEFGHGQAKTAGAMKSKNDVAKRIRKGVRMSLSVLKP